MLSVPITVVRHDPAAMGRIGAELAYARLDGEDALPQKRTIGCEVVARGSGEVPAP
jgi:LacI family transcriptional regulator